MADEKSFDILGYRLKKGELFLFHHSDGFSQRHLSVSLLFDDNGHFIASYHFSAEGRSVRRFVEGPVPETVWQALQQLINNYQPATALNPFYGLTMDDLDEQRYSFNTGTTTFTVIVNGLHKNEQKYFASPAEQLLLQLRIQLRDWVEQTCQSL